MNSPAWATKRSIRANARWLCLVVGLGFVVLGCGGPPGNAGAKASKPEESTSDSQVSPRQGPPVAKVPPGNVEKPKATPPSATVAEVPANPVISQEEWTFEGSQGFLLQTAHYRLYTTTTRQSLRDRLPRFLETAMSHYTSALVKLSPPRVPLETYLLSTRSQWERMTQKLMGDQAGVYLRIQRGGFSAEGRAILYEIGPTDTYAIAAHEGWHQFTQLSFREQLPFWLEEGLSCYMEGFRWDDRNSGKAKFLPWCNPERFDELRDASRSGDLMTLAQLVRSSPQELMRDDSSLALTYYAQCWALVHFLNEGEGGRFKPDLERFILDASAGRISSKLSQTLGPRVSRAYQMRRPVPQLFEVYFGVPPEMLEDSYREFIKNTTWLGARRLIINGETPLRAVADQKP